MTDLHFRWQERVVKGGETIIPRCFSVVHLGMWAHAKCDIKSLVALSVPQKPCKGSDVENIFTPPKKRILKKEPLLWAK